MLRPSFLIAEPEPPEGVSARKLVLETGKFNVLTAHSGREALETFSQFPRVNAVILHASLNDVACEKITSGIKRSNPGMPVIVLTPTQTFQCKGADHLLNSHEPHELLDLMRSLFGDPRQSDGGKSSK